MIAIEKRNETLKGVLPKDYARPALNKVMLGELIDLISGIALGEEKGEARDLLGRVYEYFLGQFAGSEGKRGGEFYTPRSVVRVMVEMLEPYKGRVYDPCCGSGGMFVQSEKFVEAHGGRIGDIAIYGQEIELHDLAAVQDEPRRARHRRRHPLEQRGQLPQGRTARPARPTIILANPPFNISDWGGDRLREDVRWKYGVPPAGNANYAWLQHILHHLVAARHGGRGAGQRLDVVDPERRGRHPPGDDRGATVVDCMIALPGQLFYSTQIPACLWFLARDKSNGIARDRKLRDRRGEVLFIDARKLGHMVDRTRKEFSDDDIAKIAETYHAWRGEGEGTTTTCRASASRRALRRSGPTATS